jgi:N4-gp56 family major capsid protein
MDLLCVLARGVGVFCASPNATNTNQREGHQVAFTEFGTNDPQTVKRWAQRLMRETFGKMDIRALIGRGEDACIQMLTDLEDGPGDTVYYDLLSQDRSDGVNGDARLAGFETDLTFFQDTLKINQKRHAHTFKQMSQQRTVHSLRDAGKFSLSEWWAWFIEASLFAHLVGVTGDGNETVAGALGVAAAGSTDFSGNELTALDAAHLVDAGGGGTTLSMIDDAVAKAKVNNPRVAPLMINGQKRYVIYLHPYQILGLRSTTGAGTWNEIHQRASAQGASNPIYSGAMGEYNGCIIRESEFVPSVATVRTGVLLGRGAGVCAFGNAWKKSKRKSGGGGSYFDWKERTDDYDNEEGVAGVSCLGMKGSEFDNAAFGRIGLRSTEAAPS